ncbi:MULTISPECIES: thioredoxin family protein [Rhodococcus]|uniref:thioredoxin family protein n=1 Tax=Rhodococcus TaxID=1827 RepID=UPI00057498FF|nr:MULTISPECIES: thioredoxin family protein [Rhodococcus]KHJ70436.1 thioredoxin [Rhodococcus sp. Chr-9]MCW3470549.1 thioredoxin family protein [Rhodococcus pyridinivorans]QXU54355.1 thioredoxin family protein [Rhodococcus sp. LW-XY12]
MIAVIVLVVVIVATLAVGTALRTRSGKLRTTGASAGTHELHPALATAGVGDGVPVILHFSAPWCGPCAAVRRVVVQVLDRDPGRAREVELDLDENPVLARKLGVLSLPTTFVFDGEGRERFRASGVPSVDDLRTALSSL